MAMPWGCFCAFLLAAAHGSAGAGAAPQGVEVALFCATNARFCTASNKKHTTPSPNAKDDNHPNSDGMKRIIDLQDRGNSLRKKNDNNILAQYAIEDIVVHREQQRKANDPDVGMMDYVPKRTAYLINQIKHPDEVALLRTVYGQMFNLIGVISISEKRSKRLIDKENILQSEVSVLMERDRRQKELHEQQLDKALQMADFFISTDHGTTPALQKKFKRFFDLLHGENGITPTSQEYGMYAAFSAGLKSACLSRQVGAAISDRTGKIISTGCNDVPKALGGLYSADDSSDRRCVHEEDQICFNDKEKNSLKKKIEKELKKALAKLPGQNDAVQPLIPEEQLDGILEAIYKASNIGDLIEFSRAVHAEMDAIISLACAGTPGIMGANLYTTTFPCHSCARHIVAAGIVKVYYIEPYEKSLAKKLHGDAIAFETEDDDAEKIAYNAPHASQKVRFIHFEGVAPRQYLNFFKMAKRKDRSGKVIKIIPKESSRVIGEYLDDYRTFEAKVVDHLTKQKPDSKKPDLTSIPKHVTVDDL